MIDGEAPTLESDRTAPDTGELARGSTLGRFVIVDRIGAGAMGVVYRAYDPELDRSVAIKLLRPWAEPALADEGRARLAREAQAMARLSHPNVVPVYEVGRTGGHDFLVMEHVVGETLSAWGKASRTPAEILATHLAAARGLAAAHAAGLVHRDYKPDNVLVGADGRVRVGDFGLVGLTARRDGDGAPEPAIELTETGTALGTPRYMSPEQHRREPATARSDQFAFSVTLWTALAGEPPFAGDTYRDLARSVLAGTRREPPRDARMSPAIRRALDRGLAGDADARFPDMDALIAALEPPRSNRRAALAGGGAFIGIGAAALTFALTRPGPPPAPPPEVCNGGPARLATVWTPERAADLAATLRATNVPGVAVISDAAIARLDKYAGTWTDAHREACRATQRGEQSEAVMDLRMYCLDRRLRELDVLATTIATTAAATAAEVIGLDAATFKLTPVEQCADAAALASPLAPDPAKRAEVEAIDAELAKIKVALDTGRFDAAIEAGRALEPRAEATGHGPQIAELGRLIGKAEVNKGKRVEARQTLERAARTAEASHHDWLAAEVWADLVQLVGNDLNDPEAAGFLARLADAAVLRIGDPPRARGLLESSLGALAAKHGDTDGAIAHWERAASLIPVGEPLHAGLRHNLAGAYDRAGRATDADAARAEALAIVIGSFGEKHPRTLIARYGAANRMMTTGPLDGALRAHQAVLADREAVLGADHPDVAHSLNSIAWLQLELGHLDEAAAAVERATALNASRNDPWPALLNTRAAVSLAQGHVEVAREQALAALALHAAGNTGPERGDPANVHEVLADIELAAGNWRATDAEAQKAIALHTKNRGPDSPMLASPLTSAARAQIELGNLAAAAPLIERATKLAGDAWPPTLGRARMAAVELHWRAGRRAEAHAAVTEVRAALASAGLPDDGLLGREIAAWIAAHPAP